MSAMNKGALSAKRLVTLVFFAAMACLSENTKAEQKLTVKLDTPYPYDASRSSIVHVIIANEGDEDVAIYEWNTPFVQSDNRLAKPLFEVTDASGAKVRYIGRWVNTGRVLANQFIILHPGERREADVDLRLEYDYGPGGAFAVSYVLSLEQGPDSDVVTPEEYAAFRRNRQKESESNVTAIYINSPVERVSSIGEADCDGGQLGVIKSADSKLFDPIYGAWVHMSSRYKKEYAEDGTLHNVFVPHPRYTRWFGKKASADPNLGEEGFAASNDGHAYSIVRALFRRLLDPVSRNPVLKCGCPDYPETTPAWSEADAPYVIHFCDSFFKLQEVGLPSSRVGTLVHEMSHFNDDVEGTADYLYGRPFSEDLAKNDRWKAVRNADNVEFFVVDTTPYDERNVRGDGDSTQASYEAEK